MQSKNQKENRINNSGKPPLKKLEQAKKQLFDSINGFQKIVDKSEAILRRKQSHSRQDSDEPIIALQQIQHARQSSHGSGTNHSSSVIITPFDNKQSSEQVQYSMNSYRQIRTSKTSDRIHLYLPFGNNESSLMFPSYLIL